MTWDDEGHWHAPVPCRVFRPYGEDSDCGECGHDPHSHLMRSFDFDEIDEEIRTRSESRRHRLPCEQHAPMDGGRCYECGWGPAAHADREAVRRTIDEQVQTATEDRQEARAAGENVDAETCPHENYTEIPTAGQQRNAMCHACGGVLVVWVEDCKEFVEPEQTWRAQRIIRDYTRILRSNRGNAGAAYDVMQRLWGPRSVAEIWNS